MNAPRSVILALPLLLVAAPVPVARAADDQAGEPAAAIQTNGDVVLEEAGASPRQRLRYDMSVGDLQTVQLTLASTITTTMDELAMPTMKMPTTATTITTRIDEVTKTGMTTVSLRIDAAEIVDAEGVQPMLSKQIENSIGGTVGQSATMVVSDRGIGKSLSFDDTAKTNPVMTQILESLESTFAMLATPLPEEPVGPGARWTVESTISQQMVSVTQVVTYTLEGVEDGVLTLGLEVKHAAEPQKMALQQAPPGAEIELLSLSLEGSGRATLSLSNLAPSEAAVESTSESVISLKQPTGSAQRFKQSAESSATLKQKD